jgi:transcriptional regulator with XRE-family HTH domain
MTDREVLAATVVDEAGDGSTEGSVDGDVRGPFAERLRTARIEAGFTQPQVAERLSAYLYSRAMQGGRSPQSIANWETGRSRPRINVIGALAHALTPDLIDDELATKAERRGRRRRVEALRQELWDAFLDEYGGGQP